MARQEVAMTDARFIVLVVLLLAMATAGAYWLAVLSGDCETPKTTIGTVMKVAGC